MNVRLISDLVFVAEWFADLDYSAEGKLIITKCASIFPVRLLRFSVPNIVSWGSYLCRKHDPVSEDAVKDRVNRLLQEQKITTVSGVLPLPDGVDDVSICCHSDTPVSHSRRLRMCVR